ncbi:XRE family transcriptional regulator [Escherichia coli]|uniref:XRE family transcriptional regulator n=1 Tax=Escherichia coli TaxID=562 RepID=UPI00201EEC9B|nr:XRE family transcriptional regulator [Escherichia coli]
MEYMDWVELGMKKRDRKMTKADVGKAMGFSGNGGINHKFNRSRDTTNANADDVLKMLAVVGWQAIIFDSNGKIVMGTAHVDSPEGMEQKFIKRCEELSKENEALKAEIAQLKAKAVPTVDGTDVTVDVTADVTADVTPRVRRNPKPQLFTIADLKLALKAKGGVFEGSLNQLGDLLAVEWCNIDSRADETLKPSKVVVCRLLKAAVEAGVVQVDADKPQGPKTIVLL